MVMPTPREPTRWCSPPRRLPASTASLPSAARRRWPRSPTAPQSLPRVDKIVGPGNVYVAEAKRQVFGDGRHRHGRRPLGDPRDLPTAPRPPTGSRWIFSRRPSTTKPRRRILLSPDARAISTRWRPRSSALLPGMPRRDIIAASLAARGALIQARDLDEACALANRIAPEHLELSVEEPQRLAADKLAHAGAIFLGRWSSEAIGDYCAGPNHVLPTAGTRALLLAARRLRLPEALERHRGVPRRRRDPGPHLGRAGRRRRARRARRLGEDALRMSPDKLVRPEILALKAYPSPRRRAW